MVRLGDGTEESHGRMQAAVDFLWRYTGDLLATDEVEAGLVAEGVIPPLDDVRVTFDATVRTVLEQATLTLPADPYQRLGGRVGVHTEHLGHLLPEMQRLYRSHPGARW
jgi:ring-1,2-phenylacetyl-CoA epoxidase subunit PaaC